MPYCISPQKLDLVKSYYIKNSKGDTGYNFTIWARFTRVTLTSYAILTNNTDIFGSDEPNFFRKIKN